MFLIAEFLTSKATRVLPCVEKASNVSVVLEYLNAVHDFDRVEHVNRSGDEIPDSARRLYNDIGRNPRSFRY